MNEDSRSSSSNFKEDERAGLLEGAESSDHSIPASHVSPTTAAATSASPIKKTASNSSAEAGAAGNAGKEEAGEQDPLLHGVATCALKCAAPKQKDSDGGDVVADVSGSSTEAEDEDASSSGNSCRSDAPPPCRSGAHEATTKKVSNEFQICRICLVRWKDFGLGEWEAPIACPMSSKLACAWCDSQECCRVHALYFNFMLGLRKVMDMACGYGAFAFTPCGFSMHACMHVNARMHVHNWC